MADYLTNDTELTSIANAIRSKSGSSGTMEFPDGFVSAIGNIPTGGGSGGNKTVVFFDGLANNGEGGVVTSYTPEEFAALSAMPANPDHSTYSTHGISIPMTSQGWNWSLADAKAYVAKYGALNIGQIYVPTDGKTHYICYVPTDAPPERWNTEIDLMVSGGSINWQIDNEEIHDATSNIFVTFQSVGWHDVKISALDGITYYPYYSSSSKSQSTIGSLQRIISVYIGNKVTAIGERAFYHCYSLTSITFSNSIASIGSYAFCECYLLKYIMISNNITSIGARAFYNCKSLTYVSISNSVTSSIETYTFYNCYSLKFIAIPNDVSIIGDRAFCSCNSLISITIPDNVTSIGSYAFSGCNSLEHIAIPYGVISVGTYTFQGCYSLRSAIVPDSVTSIETYAFYECNSLEFINIPDSVTQIGQSAFYDCANLKSIIIPDSVTKIGATAFNACHGLTTITIPDSVIQIGGSAFNACYGLKNIVIENSTPPELENINVFNNLSSDYSIIVPQGSLSAYTSATNWSDLASHIVEAT